MSRQPPATDRSSRTTPSGPAAPTSLKLPLPPATVQAWRAYREGVPQNPGLISERFAPDWRAQATLKKDGLGEVIRAAKRADGGLLRHWNARWQRTAAAAAATPFSLATDWRFVTGLGAHGPLEVGFTFHHYGFPFLPGSSVKGVARMAGLVAVAEGLGADDLRELDGILSLDDDDESRKQLGAAYAQAGSAEGQPARQFRAIFGTTGTAGGGVFFDAIPADPPVLELDIMNPHYPRYYQGEEPPTSWQSPVPVYFLTVAPGTVFRFAVGWRGRREGAWQGLRALAEDWLKQGLAELGAGAKTGAGYGYFAAPALVAERDAPPNAEAAPARAAPGSPHGPPPARTPPAEPVQQRRGTIVEINPQRRVGRVRDRETGREYRFTMSELEGGRTPARREEVEFHLQGDRVVLVRRLR